MANEIVKSEPKQPKKTRATSSKLDLDKLSQDIIRAKDEEAVKQACVAFRLANAKKELIRVVKLTELLDKVEELMMDKLSSEQWKIEISDLANLTKTLETSIDRSNKMIGLINDAANEAEQIKININVSSSVSDLDVKGRERVRGAVAEALKVLQRREEAIVIEGSSVVVEDGIKEDVETVEEETKQETQNSSVINIDDD